MFGSNVFNKGAEKLPPSKSTQQPLPTYRTGSVNTRIHNICRLSRSARAVIAPGKAQCFPGCFRRQAGKCRIRPLHSLEVFRIASVGRRSDCHRSVDNNRVFGRLLDDCCRHADEPKPVPLTGAVCRDLLFPQQLTYFSDADAKLNQREKIAPSESQAPLAKPHRTKLTENGD